VSAGSTAACQAGRHAQGFMRRLNTYRLRLRNEINEMYMKDVPEEL